MRRLLAIGALAALVAGCAIQQDALEPSISLANVTLERVGLLRQDLMLDLRIGNPNNFDIPIEGLTLRLDVDGQPFAEGFSNERLAIPRLAEVSVPIRASANTITLVQRIMALGDHPEIRYRMSGLVYVPGITGSRGIPYTREGSLSLAPGTRPPRDNATDPLRLAPL